MKRATHGGHCQVCDRPQAVNPSNNRLAKHGYTTRFTGFFYGTCVGSDHLPYELSKDLLEGIIAKTQVMVEALDIEAKELRTTKPGETETSTWVNVFIPAAFIGGGKRSKSRSEWRKVEVLKYQTAHRTIWAYNFVGGNGVAEMRELGYGSENLADLIFRQNVAYSRYLEQRANTGRVHIQWLQARLANWKPRELLLRVPAEVA